SPAGVAANELAITYSGHSRDSWSDAVDRELPIPPTSGVGISGSASLGTLSHISQTPMPSADSVRDSVMHNNFHDTVTPLSYVSCDITMEPAPAVQERPDRNIPFYLLSNEPDLLVANCSSISLMLAEIALFMR